MDESKALEQMSPREEIEALLATDEGRLGDVFRLSAEGLQPPAIADRLNVTSHAFVYNNRRIVEAMLDGRPVDGPSFRKQVLGAFATTINRARAALSPEAMTLLLTNRAIIEAFGADEDPVIEAQAAAAELRRLRSDLRAAASSQRPIHLVESTF